MTETETGINKPLPLDIIHEILLCLPVQTLTKFRLVCKPWDSLISHPSFQDDYYRRHLQNCHVIQLENDDGDHFISTYSKTIRGKEHLELAHIKTFSIADRDLGTRCYRIQSCLGLVCVSSTYQNTRFVCNPTTGKLQVLPPTSGPITCIGFGYASSTKEFKVVRFDYSRDTIICNVFTLGTVRWREAGSPTFQTQRVCPGVAPFIQGALHLLHRESDDVSITAFDIETEAYKQILAPKYYYTDAGFLELLSELGGLLSLIGKRGNILEVWLLKDYKGGQWVKGYKIDLFIASRHAKDIYKTTLLEILGNGSIIMCHYGFLWNELICYHPLDKVAMILEEREESEDCAWGIFGESFQPLKASSYGYDGSHGGGGYGGRGVHDHDKRHHVPILIRRSRLKLKIRRQRICQGRRS